MKKQKEIIIPILNDEYKVIVCWGSPEYVDKIAQSWFYEKGEIFLREENRAATFDKFSCHPVIVLRKYPETPEEIGTVAHEAVHAINDIFKKINDTNLAGEVFAHCVGAVVRETIMSVGWKKRKIKPKLK